MTDAQREKEHRHTLKTVYRNRDGEAIWDLTFTVSLESEKRVSQCGVYLASARAEFNPQNPSEKCQVWGTGTLVISTLGRQRQESRA